MEAEYDEAVSNFKAVEEQLDEYLREQKKTLRSADIRYRDIGKEIFQLEVPAHIKVPNDYIVMSKTKVVRT